MSEKHESKSNTLTTMSSDVIMSIIAYES